MVLRELNINDKALFDRYFSMCNFKASEMTFTNLFMWRRFYGIRFFEAEGFLCVVAVPETGAPFAFMPAGRADDDSFGRVFRLLYEFFAENGWKLEFRRVEEDYLPFFKRIEGFDMRVVYDRDNSDYVYSTEDLIHLKGKKYHGKRNHINKFKKTYEFEYVVLTEELIEDCKRIVTVWCENRVCDCLRGDNCEKHANMELLENFGALGCSGALIKVNGSFEAFTVGEMLNRDTAVIHIEKANTAIDGLYTVINQQFCEHRWADVPRINREQDMGVPGLRKSKLSYEPIEMVNKYIITDIIKNC